MKKIFEWIKAKLNICSVVRSKRAIIQEDFIHECRCENRDCFDCYTKSEYELAFKIYQSYAKEYYGERIDSPFTHWIIQQLKQEKS